MTETGAGEWHGRGDAIGRRHLALLQASSLQGNEEGGGGELNQGGLMGYTSGTCKDAFGLRGMTPGAPPPPPPPPAIKPDPDAEPPRTQPATEAPYADLAAAAFDPVELAQLRQRLMKPYVSETEISRATRSGTVRTATKLGKLAAAVERYHAELWPGLQDLAEQAAGEGGAEGEAAARGGEGAAAAAAPSPAAARLLHVLRILQRHHSTALPLPHVTLSRLLAPGGTAPAGAAGAAAGGACGAEVVEVVDLVATLEREEVAIDVETYVAEERVAGQAAAGVVVKQEPEW